MLPLFVNLIFATDSKFVPVITSCLLNDSDPPVATIFGDTEVNVAVFTVVVVVDDDDDVVVVAVAVVCEVLPSRIVKPFLYSWACPSGFVTTTPQGPSDASEGRITVQEITPDAETITLVATIFELPDFTRATEQFDWKLVPRSSVIDTVVPAFPLSGSIPVTWGADNELVVAVAVAVLVAVAWVVGKGVGVAIGVGVLIGTADTVFDPTFCVYTFSITDRLIFSVLESMR